MKEHVDRCERLAASLEREAGRWDKPDPELNDDLADAIAIKAVIDGFARLRKAASYALVALTHRRHGLASLEENHEEVMRRHGGGIAEAYRQLAEALGPPLEAPEPPVAP